MKWHEEGEKNNAYFLGLMNSKYSRLDLHKITDEQGTVTDKKQSWKKLEDFIRNFIKREIKVGSAD